MKENYKVDGGGEVGRKCIFSFSLASEYVTNKMHN